jgi:hypothetical protein
MEQHYIVLGFSSLLVIIAFYAGFFTYQHVKVTRNRSLTALVVSWFSWGIANLCTIIASVVESYYPNETYEIWRYLVIAGFFFQILAVFNLILFVDQNAQSSAGSIKIALVCIIGSLYMILPFLDGQMVYDDISIYKTNGLLFWVQLAFGLLYFLIYVLWIVRIWKNSPKPLKRVTTTLFITHLSSSLIAIIAYLTTYETQINIIALYAFHGGAMLAITVAIRVDPRIINILPFVAERLLVINRSSGVLMYEFSWTSEERKNLSSFIHGIQQVSQDTFKVGSLKGLDLDEGYVLLHYSEKCLYALLTTKSTKYLQSCFKIFKEEFEKEIQQNEIKVNGVINSADFEFGNKLVDNYFKYIPIRREN